MSTLFRIECHQDGEKGPQMKRTAGGVTVLDQAAWGAFLIEHEHHPMELWRDAVSAIEPPPTPQPTDCPSCGRSHDYCSDQSFRGRDACCMTCDEVGRGPNHQPRRIEMRRSDRPTNPAPALIKRVCALREWRSDLLLFRFCAFC